MEEGIYYQVIVFNHETEETDINTNLTKEQVLNHLDNEYYLGFDFDDCETREEVLEEMKTESYFLGDSVTVNYSDKQSKIVNIKEDFLVLELANFIFNTKNS